MKKTLRQQIENNNFNKIGVLKTSQNSVLVLFLFLIMVAAMITGRPAHAEYGDILINNYSEEAGMRPAVFPHWFHRIRFRCKVCHEDLGFKFKAGGNEINMLKIIDGEYCGACHDGDIAWAVDNCDLCHSGQRGQKTQVHGSTLQKLKAPSGENGK